MHKNYYLQEQEADNRKQPWFRYIKTMDQYSEKVLITPEMAKELLNCAKQQFTLRKPSSNVSVSISLSGRLLDGQTVLKSIVNLNKSKKTVVVFNISDLGV